MYAAQLVFALYLILPVASHIALWDPAMYGWDPTDINQNDAVTPLADLPFDQWWFHGYINQPPAEGTFMNLPSGGTYHGQVACNKAQTTYGVSAGTEYACPDIGPMHTSDTYGTPNPKDVMGCGLAIAYESDVTKIQPEDFAVISINYECPWKKNVDFEIPGDLPPCPEGGCHCLWGWVHNSDSGSEQNYILGYRCNVTGATGTQAIPKPQVARKCDYPTDTSNCTVGVKQPHYWYQAERNNNFQGTYDPPFYNGKYGYMNGAQTDIFANTAPSSGVRPSAASASASASTSASATTTTSARIAGHTDVPDEPSSSAIPTASGFTIPIIPLPIGKHSSSSVSSSSEAAPLPSSSSARHTSSASSRSSAVVAPSSSVKVTPSGIRNATLVPGHIGTTNTTLINGTIPVPVNATSTSKPGKTCKRRKRSYERLDDPEVLRQHEERQARRVERKLKRAAVSEREVTEEDLKRHRKARRTVKRHGRSRDGSV